MEEKDLEKLTATKLREIAKQYEGIEGVHAMKKEELIFAIRDARGEPQKPAQKAKAHTISSLKKQIKKMKEEKKAALKKEKNTINVLRRKIKRCRRQTRKLAKVKS